MARTLNAQASAPNQFPKEDPQWDPNEERRFQMLEHYQEALLGSLKEGGTKAMNMSKTLELLQGPKESPSQFYKRMCEAFLPLHPL